MEDLNDIVNKIENNESKLVLFPLAYNEEQYKIVKQTKLTDTQNNNELSNSIQIVLDKYISRKCT